jgi:hypothetical protein
MAGLPAFVRTCIEKAIGTRDQPPLFAFVLKTLENDVGKRAPSPLSALLLRGLVQSVVANEQPLSAEEATRLAQAAAKIDRGFDYKLLAHTASSSPEWPDKVDEDQVMRVLTIVDEISDCQRLVLPLIKFAKLRSMKLRSKAVKLMARGNTNTNWADVVLSDPNPRVRANLLEEFAAQLGRKAEPLLRKASKDLNHRVCTAALLALSRLGDHGSRERLEHFAVEGDTPMRRASVWALLELDSIPSTEAPRRSA